MSSGHIKTTNDFFVVKAQSEKIPGHARYGLIASKRIFKLAVERNRAKRLARDWLTVHEDLMLPDFDYVFILQKPILNCHREFGRRNMKRSLKNIARTYRKNVLQPQ